MTILKTNKAINLLCLFQ